MFQLEAKVVDLEHRMRAMEEREMVTNRRVAALEQFQSAIVHALGYTTPPGATQEQCVLKIKGLEKSCAVAGIADESALRRQLKDLRKELKKAGQNLQMEKDANQSLRKQVNDLRTSGAGSSAKASTKLDRQLMQLFHSDKCANASVEELRAKMEEAFRLVNGSRADA